jgi:hypothetical protein
VPPRIPCGSHIIHRLKAASSQEATRRSAVIFNAEIAEGTDQGNFTTDYTDEDGDRFNRRKLREQSAYAQGLRCLCLPVFAPEDAELGTNTGSAAADNGVISCENSFIQSVLIRAHPCYPREIPTELFRISEALVEISGLIRLGIYSFNPCYPWSNRILFCAF